MTIKNDKAIADIHLEISDGSSVLIKMVLILVVLIEMVFI